MLKIALAGPICSGKSTIAAALGDEFGYRRLAFADALKAEVAGQHGIGVAELNENKAIYRADLETLGERRRASNPLYWCNLLAVVLDAYDQMDRPVVVDDLRYINEADFLRARGFVIVGVATPDAVREQRHQARYGKPLPPPSEAERQAKLVKSDFIMLGTSAPLYGFARLLWWLEDKRRA